jgi:hypothetical protein
VRVDTNIENKAMMNLLEKSGYISKGLFKFKTKMHLDFRGYEK